MIVLGSFSQHLDHILIYGGTFKYKNHCSEGSLVILGIIVILMDTYLLTTNILFPAQTAFVNVIPCCSDRRAWCWSPRLCRVWKRLRMRLYMRPMQQKSVRCFPLSPGSGRDARLPCITTLELF